MALLRHPEERTVVAATPMLKTEDSSLAVTLGVGKSATLQRPLHPEAILLQQRKPRRPTKAKKGRQDRVARSPQLGGCNNPAEVHSSIVVDSVIKGPVEVTRDSHTCSLRSCINRGMPDTLFGCYCVEFYESGTVAYPVEDVASMFSCSEAHMPQVLRCINGAIVQWKEKAKEAIQAKAHGSSNERGLLSARARLRLNIICPEEKDVTLRYESALEAMGGTMAAAGCWFEAMEAALPLAAAPGEAVEEIVQVDDHPHDHIQGLLGMSQDGCLDAGDEMMLDDVALSLMYGESVSELEQ